MIAQKLIYCAFIIKINPKPETDRQKLSVWVLVSSGVWAVLWVERAFRFWAGDLGVRKCHPNWVERDRPRAVVGRGQLAPGQRIFVAFVGNRLRKV